MPTNIDEFAAEVTSFVSTRPAEDMNDLLQAIGLDMLSGFVFVTPVRTGRARGNWQVSINVIVEDAIERFSDPTQIEAAKLTQLTEFPIIYIQNNVDYIEFLNQGSSPQADAGFFELQFETTAAKFAEAG